MIASSGDDHVRRAATHMGSGVTSIDRLPSPGSGTTPRTGPRTSAAVGHATGEKEETTIAANTLTLIDEPLEASWLQRVRRSTSAEPLREPVYRQARLSVDAWEELQLHPQFR